MIVEIISITALGALTSAIASFLQSKAEKIEANRQPPLSQRIEDAVGDLRKAVKVFEELDSEVHRTKQRAEELSNEAKKYQAIVSANQEQVDAFLATFSETLDKKDRKSFIRSFLVNLTFFVLGVLASALIAITV